MKKLLLAGGVVLALGACTQIKALFAPGGVQAALATPAGALFCSIQTKGGGAFVANLIVGASSAAGAAGPLIVMATNAVQSAVNADCAKAATVVAGVSGIPVSPPVNPAAVVPQIAISNPASPTQAVPAS